MNLLYVFFLMIISSVSTEDHYKSNSRESVFRTAGDKEFFNLNNLTGGNDWNIQIKCLSYVIKQEILNFEKNKCKQYLPVNNGHYSIFAAFFSSIILFPMISWIIYRVSHEYGVGQILSFSLRKSGIIIGILWILKCLLLLFLLSKLKMFSLLLINIPIFLTGITGIISYIKRSVLFLQTHILVLIGTKLTIFVLTIFLLTFFSAKNSEVYNNIYNTNFLIHPIYTYVLIYSIPLFLTSFLFYIIDLTISLNTLSVFRIGGSADECFSAQRLLESNGARWNTGRFFRSTAIEYIPHFQTHKLFKSRTDVHSPYRYDLLYCTENKKNMSLNIKYDLNSCKNKKDNARYIQNRPYSCSDKSRLLS